MQSIFFRAFPKPFRNPKAQNPNEYHITSIQCPGFVRALDLLEALVSSGFRV